MTEAEPLTPGVWTRPKLERPGPIRTAEGLFRARSGPEAKTGETVASSVNDTVEAIVRMAYRVAESQSERSQRLAQRLSCGSGDADTVWKEIEDQAREVLKVGTDAAAVNLVALKQLVQSECKVLQALLSLLGIDSCGGNDGTQVPKVSPVRIVHVADTADRRAVLVQAWRLHGEPPDVTRLHFIHVEHPSDPRIEAELSLAEMGPPRLALRTPAEARSGLWRAPICDSNDIQVGIIDILL
jgi:hypothetical protein